VKECIQSKTTSLYPKDVNICDICCGCLAVHPKPLLLTSFIGAPNQRPSKTFPTPQRNIIGRPANLNVNSSLNAGLIFTRRFSVDYFNVCQSTHNTLHTHRLLSLQHVSAAYSGHHQLELYKITKKNILVCSGGGRDFTVENRKTYNYLLFPTGILSI
jgi:hypothetical protein